MKIFYLIPILLFAATVNAQNIYNLNITASNGSIYPLSSYSGQKIMFAVLPPTQTADDSAYLTWLDSVAISDAGQLTVIAVPSYEDGFVADSSNTLMAWYRNSLDSSVVISQPTYTHSSSGLQQDNVFAWLTHTEQNGHFDYEVTGPGTMFFIDSQGNLFGLFGPEAKYSSKVINKMMQ